MPHTVAVAGTTPRTIMCAKALLSHPEFKISFIITPAPKPIGRDRKFTENQFQIFANSNQLSTVLIKNKVDEEVKKEISKFKKPDFLLVVDFGYLVPGWLLNLPKIMPLNIHPSALPKWRGSSPGQSVLLSGEKESAVSVIEMTPQFDQGPIVWQKKFAVNQSWTQSEYYQFSFELVCKELSKIMLGLANGKIIPLPQPTASPTALALRITKQDAFVDWKKIKQAMGGGDKYSGDKYVDCKYSAELERASRAYSPWPLLWTKVLTNKGLRRMQIISAHVGQNEQLVLEKVKIEGMEIKPWNEVKNVMKN